MESDSSPQAPQPLVIGNSKFLPGDRGVVDLHIGSLIDYQPVTMSVHVRRSKAAGPTLLLTAGIHGDEIIGIEILRQTLKSSRLRQLRGTLIVVPVVCMPAFLSRSRYLPDGRDLNRLFPGSREGSLGGRLAATFVNEVVSHCTHAIDFHAGGESRPNLPQIRISPRDEGALALAKAFNPPVVIESGLREGSLRSYFRNNNIPSLLFEGGEAYRLDQSSVKFGLRGIFSVMQELGMLPRPRTLRAPQSRTLVANQSVWMRAPRGGIFTPFKDLGNAITAGTQLGHVADPFGREETPLISEVDGIIIGVNREATTDEGDALFHIASTSNPARAEVHIQRSEVILDQSSPPILL